MRCRVSEQLAAVGGMEELCLLLRRSSSESVLIAAVAAVGSWAAEGVHAKAVGTCGDLKLLQRLYSSDSRAVRVAGQLGMSPNRSVQQWRRLRQMRSEPAGRCW